MAKKMTSKEPVVSEAMEEAIADTGFYLPKEKILVRFIKRQTGFITNPDHIGFGGMLEGATVTLPAKQDRAGNYIEVLTRDEQKGLEEYMGVDENYLSIHKPKDNFWDTVKINLGKEGLWLDLENAYDFIKYKILLTYNDMISPSITETKHKKGYKFEIVRKIDQDNRDSDEVGYDIQAYKLFGKYEDSREQLAGIIRVLGGKSASTNDHGWLIKEVGKLVKKDPKRFVEVLTDPNYKIKLFIEKGISKKAIMNNRGKYTTKDGISLCEEGETPTLVNAIKFLNNIKNQEIKLAIEAGY